MSKKVPLGLTLLLIVFTALVTFLSTFVGVGIWSKSSSGIADGNSELYNKLRSVDDLFRTYYINEMDEDSIIDGIIAGYVAGSGDKYAAYFNKEDYAAFISDNNAQLQGIGVHVIYNADFRAIEVINVMPNSPALEAGVMPGDIIISVGDKSVATLGYYGAVSAMRGDAGTYAVFTVLRGDDYSEQKEFSIERGYVTEQTVISRLYEADPTIGIVRILQFDAGTPGQFIEALETLQSQGAGKFVLDVRYNPGGDLQAICKVLDYLLPEGPIVRTVYKNGQENVINSDANEFKYPMAVLINGSTASAGELFASALKDYNKATLVGVTTYGKGTMQSIIKLADDSAVSISVALYNPPFSDNYEGVGVKPDIEIEMPEHLKNVNIYKISDEEDTQLLEAIKVLS
ncbi:MAG: S41 family peptidase [Clostridiales bacterium]|nr:S41 family peptidase [Clostridiales bacterium]